ncbi:DUF397 domain-containing protein [Streptomyces sp. NBC_01387]|uniref:DUF397 domain-containing protein n=1 Tax=unclassified Streptomyces TaxID=2593676 RepID=UPI00202548F6|nr:DUF397 domain-containing protein [Streptomyces sp. A 4/2]WSV55988.1 DUF397 domain-containing protein [Streptomyces sp. NBC_01014]
MDTYRWQKSSFSGEAANCVDVAIAPDGGIALRESDSPSAILTTTPASLGALLAAVRHRKFTRRITKSI